MNFWQYYFLPTSAHWWTGGIYGNIFASIIWSSPIVYTIYHTRIKCSRCWRPSYHKVLGTHYKTCHKHSTVASHLMLQDKHRRKYPLEHHLLKKDQMI